MKNKILTLIILFLLLFGSTGLSCVFAKEIEYTKGMIIDVLSETGNQELEDAFGSDQSIQTVKVKILSGPFQDKEVIIKNQLTSNPAYDIFLKKNDRVLIGIEELDKEHISTYIVDKERIPILYIVIGLFFLLLLIIGGKQGFNALVSILITAALIFGVLIPYVMSGNPVIPVTVLVAILSTTATMLIVGGLNLKSLGAIIGTVISLFIAGLLSIFAIKFGSLTGFSDQESIILWSSNPDLNFKGILTSSMIIAALGAIMDVGMSISSCINEFKKVNNTLTFKELVKSGMNVGKDIIGTMSNTLILAYIGGSMALLLLLENVSLIKFLNLNSVVSEIISALVGSIGIILCVPITAVISAYLMKYKPENKS